MDLAEKLFFRHFDGPVDALRRFERNLGSVGLPFDVLARLREIEYPPYPGYDQGMPSFIYYFVPGTGWGTFNKASTNPIAHEFVYDEFPQSYLVSCDRKQRDDRIVIRGSVPALPFKSGSIYFGVVRTRPSKKWFSPPLKPHPMTIAKYLEDGEPVFKVITPP